MGEPDEAPLTSLDDTSRFVSIEEPSTLPACQVHDSRVGGGAPLVAALSDVRDDRLAVLDGHHDGVAAKGVAECLV